MIQKGLHCFVSGRVQGVFYRANTQKKAIELGLTGWVRNLPDGRVEALAFGKQEQLKVFELWLHQGPARAEVAAVEVQEVPFENHAGFNIM